MPVRSSDILRMRELRTYGLRQVRSIETFLLDAGHQNEPGLWDWLSGIEQTILEMDKLVGPVVNAAEKVAEEYHQLREELEEEYTSGNYKPV